MHSEELYLQMLGLTAPWRVERMDLNMAEQRVYVVHPTRQWFTSPACNRELVVYDHLPERTWRHRSNVLTYLLIHRITNAVAKGINAKIPAVQRRLRLSQSGTF